jgi:hypothetical protein
MPYSNKEFSTSNVNYINKAFPDFKDALLQYAKSYFPNTYKDFNETSPGMMLIEMSAYVGDVLSFYIDQQYREMLLPLAEERRSIINLANTLGYKVKPTTPAFTTLTFTQTVDSMGSVNDKVPNYGQALVLDNRVIVQSSTNPTIKFQTLDHVDFTASGSYTTQPEVFSTDEFGIVDKFKLTRKVKAVSGTSKTKTVSIGAPEKFYKISLPETDVLEILSVTDSNTNSWYEVPYLAQDKVKQETYWESGRANAYSAPDGTVLEIPVPYTLSYLKSSKRFIVEVDENNITSLVFGNGLLKSGQTFGVEFLETIQAGIVIPGETSNYDFAGDESIDLTLNDSKGTLGEIPNHTTLTISYRIGGGIDSNVSTADLTTLDLSSITPVTTGKNLTVTNAAPAYGGSDGESIDQIRYNAKAFFATQNRCVTKEDYNARIMNLPAKFGNIAKVFTESSHSGEGDELMSTVSYNLADVNQDDDVNVLDVVTIVDEILNDGSEANILEVETGGRSSATVEIYMLSYNNNKNLVTLPANNDTSAHPLKQNLINYLDEYRMLTDVININDGKIINFGVAFDITAHKQANKDAVKILCINTIQNYFNIDKLQFHQPIFTSDLEYELMGLEGVRSVNWIELTQNFSDLVGGSVEHSGEFLWDYDINNLEGNLNTGKYGWLYDFKVFYDGSLTPSLISDGVILPSKTPSVFELKNPAQNIIGVVR